MSDQDKCFACGHDDPHNWGAQATEHQRGLCEHCLDECRRKQRHSSESCTADQRDLAAANAELDRLHKEIERLKDDIRLEKSLIRTFVRERNEWKAKYAATRDARRVMRALEVDAGAFIVAWHEWLSTFPQSRGDFALRCVERKNDLPDIDDEVTK